MKARARVACGPARRATRVRRLAWLVLAAALAVPAAAADEAPPAARQRELLHMVRQDCGSCHGLRLTGGLGPPLTREALADKPVESMAATIFNGRPGTPMPAWRSFVSAAEAHWIASLLARGFPDDPGAAP